MQNKTQVPCNTEAFLFHVGGQAGGHRYWVGDPEYMRETSRNKKLIGDPGLTTRSKDATRAPGITTSNKGLVDMLRSNASPCVPSYTTHTHTHYVVAFRRSTCHKEIPRSCVEITRWT